MRGLYDARERQQNLSKLLQTHEQELENIREILYVVGREPILQVTTMIGDLEQLRLHGQSLHTYLQEYGKDRGQIKQYATQFFNGKRNIDEIAAVMASMSRAKANLNIKIQVIHVGLTQSVGDVVVVNCERVESLDRKLQTLFGEGKGLKLAELLRHKQPRGDGTVHLKDAELASLSDSEGSSMGCDSTMLAGSTSRRVERNESKDKSFQLNGPIGIGGYVEVDNLVIVDNKALHSSIQVNHAVSQDNFDKLMTARLASWGC
ncbi:hypothetical protein N0V93_003106 [Gnomoniopsis smithogilvyi]|uniref:Uncharacterized protein n=1 Tax=Gnomoniopsis smithogilvyi TaxID=1191159 RepID=A0A9W8Z036_9PEZI|nr:hypothetical protein N0V93_003106 [Gnomoniopsis smithogilvyi]